MNNIIAIVEGQGEVGALPVLLRRLTTERNPMFAANVLQPIKVKRDRFLNNEKEFRRQLLLAAAKSGEDGWILILLDADDDCPKLLGEKIRGRASQYIPHRKFSVVLANREFESWFIAASQSLIGFRGFSLRKDEKISAETPRDAKGWIKKHLPAGSYNEVIDQPRFAAKISLQQAFDNSRSFRKLCKDWHTYVTSFNRI